MRHINFITRTLAVLMAVWMLSACEREKQTDPRDAFIGKYSFVTKGNIDLYAGSLKIATFPMNEKGELSISAAASNPNDVVVVAENDTTIGHISGNYLFLDPTSAVETFGIIDMHLDFTYGKATLSNNTLSFVTEVAISASYNDMSLTGNGKVDIVATKE